MGSRALLEREFQLEAIERAIGSAGSGNGVLVLIEGEAGAGKTTLLRAASEIARSNGIRELSAGGNELEQGFPYGAIRTLLEREVAAEPEPSKLLSGAAAHTAALLPTVEGRESAPDPMVLCHGIYWLISGLADRTPLAITVDDVQWVDAESLEALVYLSRRVVDLPLALILALRSGERGIGRNAIEQLRRIEAGSRLDLAPLSATGVGALIASVGSREPSARLVLGCREATGGNPFLLIELLRALPAGCEDLDDDEIDALIAEAGRDHSASILSRLSALGSDAVVVAEAISVLEPNARPSHVAALAGVVHEQAIAGIGALIGGGVLRDRSPVEFAHPLIREAVHGSISTPRRAWLHGRAARVLAEAEADPDSVAAQLLLADPQGDPWVVDRLRDAAAGALARGAPRAAAGYLRRAELEPPRPSDRPTVRAALGQALLRADDPEGLDVLGALLAPGGPRERDFELASVLATSLGVRGRTDEAAAVIEPLLPLLGPEEKEIRMELLGTLATLSLLGLERIGKGAIPPEKPIPDPGSRGARHWMKQASLLIAFGVGEIRHARALVESATADAEAVRLDAEAGNPPLAASVALALADHGDLVDPLLAIGAEVATGRGAMMTFPAIEAMRLHCSFGDGELRSAQAAGDVALRLQGDSWFFPWRAVCAAMAARTAVARGQLDDAGSYRDRGVPEPLHGAIGAIDLCARGELHLAGRDPGRARDCFAAAQRRVEWLSHPNAEVFPHLPGLARCALAEGDATSARELAEHALADADATGNGRSRGIALLTLGAVATGTERLELHEQAVETLAPTRARLRHGQALVELGAALRRSNHRREARARLTEGLDIAHRCGAQPLVEAARTELAATGARPRREVVSGIDSLTPSELRVARMATDGMSNPEIAQALFVTKKTIETHLRHAFQKLDIKGRGELRTALVEPAGPAAGERR